MTTEKWQLNRLGLQNFWYYDQQIYELSHGHLLLRGGNGAGKSVTMQSLLPVLLDGNTNANRLDSFGSRDRNMLDYLMGEAQLNSENARTGYLFAEYRRGAQAYLTTGIGLSGQRGGNLKKWYFVIEDNRRIGDGFELVEAGYVLSKKQLKNRLGEGGQLFEQQKEYQNYINQHIFGFKSLADFDDCMRLLVALRNPKLNNDYGPKKLVDILSASLPALSEQDLQPIAQTLSSIDLAQESLALYRRQAKSLEPLVNSYQSYQQAHLYQLAHKWLAEQQQFKQRQAHLKQLQDQLTAQQAHNKALQQQHVTLKQQEQLLEGRYEHLIKQDAFQLVQQGQELAERKRRNEQVYQQQVRQQQRLEQRVAKAEASRDNLSAEQYQQEKVTRAYQNELSEHALTADFENNQTYLDEQKLQPAAFNFLPWRTEIKQRRQHFDQLQHQLQELQQLKAKTKQVDQIFGKLNQKLETKQHQVRVATEKLLQLRDDLFIQFTQWRAQAHFSIPNPQFTILANQVQRLFDDGLDFQELQQPLYDLGNQEQQRLTSIIFPLRSRLTQNEQQIQQLKMEMAALKLAPATPPRTEAVQHSRANLTKALAFYQCVDFKSDVAENVRNALESAMLQSGLLDSLVAARALPLVGDRQLKAATAVEPNLSQYLQVDLPATATALTETVQRILTSIQVVEQVAAPASTAELTITGAYQIALIKGQALSDYQASYIGAAAQERYRHTQLNQLQKQITTQQSASNELQKQITTYERQITAIKTDLQHLPTAVEIQRTHTQLQQLNEQVAQLQQTIEVQEKELSQLQGQQASLTVKIQVDAKGDHLALTVAAYQQASLALTEYKDTLTDWQNALQQQAMTIRNLAQAEQQLTEYQDDLVVITATVTASQAELTTLQRELQENHQQQKLLKSSDVAQQIDATITERRQNKQQLTQIDQQLQESMMQKALAEEKATQEQQQVANITIMVQLWQATFKQAYQQEHAAVTDWLQTATELLKDWQSNPPHDEQLRNNLSKQTNLAYGKLTEFQPNLSEQEIISPTEVVAAPALEKLMTTNNAAYENWRNLNRWQVLQVRLERKFITPFILQAKLQAEIEHDDLLLSESEADLFRQIIFDSVGNVIRELITKAATWAKAMNQILRQQENQSDLKLAITWQAIPNNFSHANTYQLVTLLQQDPATLRERDAESIKTILMANINAERQRHEDNNDGVTLFDILQDVLDYRHWFEFKLYTTRHNEGRLPLVQKRFNQFSGGEKAVTMYTPLFTAIYARYQNAAAMAPYIITLDEAFAGIDSSNVGEVLGTIERLGFNYVMNSQILQGEYASVSHLNTYELIRPKNGNVVTVIKYHWDGKISQIEDEPNE